ncbi:MAG: helix-turn-helix transcriptional regulator [SAR324 cluster bacterium]|nr:helix-turn-helix transcriptional regulator [SAR324 cluster bacterium]
MVAEGIDLSIKDELDDLFTNQGKNIEKAVRTLKLFAHRDRLKILCLLSPGREFTVQSLEKYTGIRQTTLSQHLSLLKDRGLVTSRREGNFSIYKVASDDIVEFFELIKRVYCR